MARRRWSKAELVERRAEAWDLYVQGWTQREIGKHLDVDQSTISDYLRDYRADQPKQTREQLIEKHQAALAWATRRLRELAEKPAPPVTAGQHGDIVRDPLTSEIVRDYSLQRQAALDLVRLQEREAKLLGLNAADVVEVTGSVTVAGSVDAELNELAAQLGMALPSGCTPTEVSEGVASADTNSAT
jgi:transcriptional regulator with XRE-family HTH domain